MKVRVQGGSEVTLTQKDFLAQGGEGQIYVVGGTAYKIYNDPSQMIPLGKIQELGTIKDPRVIVPEKLLLDAKGGQPLGFTSRFVQSEGALCQLFTRSFRDRHGVSPGAVGDLVKKLQDLVQNVHTSKVLIVDLNEMNFLLSPQLKDLYAIDTASYQTPHYRATALMESVRDRHMKPGEFTEGTDWFAFGILSFQMFIGIHPYKGKHPVIKGLDDRMKQNISVLHSDVGIPQTCYPIAAIPKDYLGWYKAVFEKGERLPPPSGMPMVFVPVQVINKTGSDALIIKEIGSFDGAILGTWEHHGSMVVATDKAIYHNGKKVGTNSARTVGFTPSGKPITVSLTGNQPVLTDVLTKCTVDCGLMGQDIMTANGTLYLKNGDKLVSLNLVEVGEYNKVILGSEVVANVLEHATKLHQGVAIQNLLGASYVSLFPAKGTHYQVRIPELDGLKVTEAKCDGTVLMVLGSRKNGTYDRLIFRFTPEFNSYDVRVVSDITPMGLNFVTLDTGICVSMTEDETLELFAGIKSSSSKVRTVTDKAVTGDMKLCKVAGKVGFTRADKLFSLSLK